MEKYKLNLTMSRWDASDYYAHQSMVLDTDDNVTEMKKMIIFERMKRELTNHAKEIDDKEELAHVSRLMVSWYDVVKCYNFANLSET